MSVSLGIENGMGENEIPYEHHYKGIASAGKVTVGSLDITEGTWLIRPYLTGEALALPSADGHSSVPWSSDWSGAVDTPLTWYYSTFPQVKLPTDGLFSVLIDMRGMGRGHCYINGHDIGRYWLIEGGDSGMPTQWLYHIPPDWLTTEGDNTLTIIEELAGVDPSKVQVVISQMLPSEAEQQVASS